jgi:imidazolonepropionase-like amidohydrolase
MLENARRARIALPAILALLLGAPASTVAQQQGTVAFVNVNVIPMDRETVLRDQTVVVQNGRITAVGPAASTQVPQGATRVDARGKFLMPGIAEIHAHVPGINPQGTPEQQAAQKQFAEDVLFLYVAAGATTIRGMQGNPAQIEMRRRVESGELIGPRMYLGAPQLGGNVPHPDTGRARVRQAKAAGFDLIKVQEGLTKEAYDAIVDEAKKQGLPWGGHVSSFVMLSGALAAKQSTVDHLDGYIEALAGDPPNMPAGQAALQADESKIPALAQATKAAGVAVVPTMSLWETLQGAHDPAQLGTRPELKYMPPQMVQGWATTVGNTRSNANFNAQTAARHIELRNKMLAALDAAGVTILMGTDAPQIFSVPGFSLYHELPVMVKAGMTTYEVLASGTINVARFFGTERETGTVATGKRADLLLLDANPLENINNIQRRAGVVVNGRWLPETEIQRRLEAIAARHRPANE